MQGEVIGINTAINAAAENIGFAIPSTQAEKIIAQLQQGQTVKRGWLGVTIQRVSENEAKALKLPEPTGALIASVGKGQPADKAGVKQGDVVLEVDGKKIVDNNDLLKKIAGLAPGDKPRLTLWRNGKRVTKTVTLGQRGKQDMKNMKPQDSKPATVLGMSLKAITEQAAKALGLDKVQGLIVVTVDQKSVDRKSVV